MNGSLLPFAPTADAIVDALAITPDGSQIIVGGEFDHINGAHDTESIAGVNPAGSLVSTDWHDIDGPALSLSMAADGQHVGVGQGGHPNEAGYYDLDGDREFHQNCDGDAQAVLILGDYLYSGYHDGCDGVSTSKLIANEISSGGDQDTSFLPPMQPWRGVRSLAGTARTAATAADLARHLRGARALPCGA